MKSSLRIGGLPASMTNGASASPGVTAMQLARDLDVPPNRIGAIVNGTRSITVDTALRLETYFRVSPETWLGLRRRNGDRIIRSVCTRPAA